MLPLALVLPQLLLGPDTSKAPHHGFNRNKDEDDRIKMKMHLITVHRKKDEDEED